MTTQMFMTLLFGYTIFTGLIVEAIKKVVTDKSNRPWNLVSLIVAVVLGLVGTLTYYQLSGIGFSVNNVILAVILGFMSGLCSQVGFDKVKQTLTQIGIKEESR